jgi:nucleoredoxin
MSDGFKWSNLFGEVLNVKGSDGNKATVSTDSHLSNKFVLVYFSAHWCPPCRGFTPSLSEFYQKMKSKDSSPFEIVFVSSDKDESSFNEYYGEMPFASLPYAERDIKGKLSSKFGVAGIPMLIVLDTDGTLMSKKGRNLVSSDPEGLRFPWKPLSLQEEIGDEFIGQGGATVNKASFNSKFLGIYFSAHWCPPCRNFTPKLVEFYKRRKELGHDDFEIIFASSDQDQGQFEEYFGEMPWLALPFKDPRISALSDRFDVEGIPAFIILDPERNVVTANARGAVTSDPNGTNFPFYPDPVENISNGVESFGCDINSKPALVVLMENGDDSDQADVKEALIPFGVRYAKDKKDTPDGPEILFFYAFEPSNMASQVRNLCKLPAVNKSGNDPVMILLDIPDNGGYYVSNATEVTSDAIGAFVDAFKAGALERKQLGK